MSRTSNKEHLEKGRITARVPMNVQETLQKAAELTGVPLNAFIVQVAHERAQDIIDWHEMKSLVLSAQDSEWFLKQLVERGAPNARLKRAFAGYKRDLEQSYEDSAVGSSQRRAAKNT